MNRFLRIKLQNDTDIAPYYRAGDVLRIYFDADIGEAIEDYIEEGEEDGELNFTPSWQRSSKRYILRTDLVSQYYLAFLHTLVRFQTIEMTLRNGSVVYPKRVTVGHSYPFDDRTFALTDIEFDLGEVAVKPVCPVSLAWQPDFL